MTVKWSLKSREREGKSLDPDTFKEAGSTFRGISIIWMVSYWAVNETRGTRKYYIQNVFVEGFK